MESVASSLAKWHEHSLFIAIKFVIAVKGLEKYFFLRTRIGNFKSRYSFEVTF